MSEHETLFEGVNQAFSEFQKVLDKIKELADQEEEEE